MQRAIELSIESINSGGGPFGSVITKENEIISEGMNRVTVNNDPTAHGEITAIRQACKKLNTFDLNGYELYSNCEPCPMCLGAIYWARPEKVYYGSTKTDAAHIGFDDDFIYEELKLPYADRSIPFEQLAPEVAIKPFQEWAVKEDKTEY